MRILTGADFFTGLFYALVLRGEKVISLEGGYFDEAVDRSFRKLMDLSEKQGIEVSFRIRLHPIYGDSVIIRQEILGAMQRGLVTLDAPGNKVMRIRLTEDEAVALLEEIAGGRELFMRLTDEFNQ
ncbi:MAG: hypothetical protein Q7R84_02100 [bacterium]|nr:hypothetical protein [bacterium]